MIDLGLAMGVKTLWQNASLQDYTLKVEDKEFRVHKVVLAAVSNFFQAMLCDSYVESNADSVELKGQCADTVSKLLEFVYTGDESLLSKTDNVLELLKCAMYLQMPAVSEFCVKKLLEQLDDQNWFEVLSALIDFAFPKEVTEVKDFIQRNWEGVLENCNLETLSSDAVQVLMDCWQTCEWDMFIFLKKWICHDYENRIGNIDNLMSKVRFCLIAPEDLKAIMKMDIYQKTEHSWQDLVVNAVKYHQLPINLKVLDRSEQSKVRKEPLPAVFQVNSTENIGTFRTLDKENKWLKAEQSGFHTTFVEEHQYVVSIEVNNFLILCRSNLESQDWHIFDPRTSTWSDMPNMEKQKYYFAMVHHKDILYTLGGSYTDDTSSYEVEQYNLLTNSWSFVHEMPVSLKDSAACSLGDCIYVSGGSIYDNKPFDGLYSLNLSSNTREWEKRASFLWVLFDSEMSVMKRNGEEGLFVLDNDFNMQFYTPSNNQWSEITNTVRPDGYDFEWLDAALLLFRGNSVFILNITVPKSDGDEVESSRVCWKLTIPEEDEKMARNEMQYFPCNTVRKIGAMLAISPQNVKN